MGTPPLMPSAAACMPPTHPSISTSTGWSASPLCFFFQAEDGIRDLTVTGVQTCALPICPGRIHAGQEPLQIGRRRIVARGRPARRRPLAVTAAPPRENGAGREGESGRGHERRSEEHTSELQSQSNLVCRLLLEKKNT